MSIESSEFTTYYYHETYDELLADMISLNDTYPEIIDLFSLNKQYDIPNITGNYEIWAIRLANESTGFEKPELLFIGTHHGNEGVSTETAYWLAWWLAKNYSLNNWIKYLIDHREIYIIPLLNPAGHEVQTRYNNNGIDLNRNYDYDWSETGSGGVNPFSEPETQCIREFVEDHQFINAISWHSGIHGIYYSWGANVHYSEEIDLSPDNNAYFNHARLMSREAGNFSEGYYPLYIWNDQPSYYPCYGAWEDWAYAAHVEYGGNYTLDADGYEGAGMLSYCVEVSRTKWPTEESLGGETVDGWIPKNIRLALVLIDLAEPYLEWTSKDSLPYVNFPNGTIIHAVAPNTRLNFNWQVNGSIQVDETDLRWGLDPDLINNYLFDGTDQEGSSTWDGDLYNQQITTPAIEGDYYFVARAQVDGLTNDSGVYPFPYSRYAKQRNWVQWSEIAENQTMHGQLDWYSPTLKIQVTTDLPSCKIVSPTFEETISGQVPIIIKVAGIETSDINNMSVVIDDNSHIFAEFAQGEEEWIAYWDTTYFSKGSHTIRTKTTTTNGVMVFSSKVDIFISPISSTSSTWIVPEFVTDFIIPTPLFLIGTVGIIVIFYKKCK